MSATSLKKKVKQTAYSSRATRKQSKNRRKKRKLSCSSVEECEAHNCRKKQKTDPVKTNCFYKSHRGTFPRNSFCDSPPNDKLVIEEKFIWDKVNESGSQPRGSTDSDFQQRLSSRGSQCSKICTNPESKCWLHDLPQEILLKIFSYLPLGVLLHTIPQICKKLELLALDWTLWKAVEDLTIKNMVISTAKLKTLLRTIPKLKKLELILRNDTEELLHELFETHQSLEVLKLDRCCCSTLQMNMRSQTVASILEFCPKLKTVMMTDTYFHSKNFYRCLAKKFRTIERINVTCTSKSEMNVFMENLKENIPEVEFQRVPMMGRAAGKQIYWGPILGLVVRPIPTSPFHVQCSNDNYPNYAF